MTRQHCIMAFFFILVVDALEQRRIERLLLHIYIAEKRLEMCYV
jgi:hypothetical protein